MHVIKLNGYNATTENGEKLELGTFDSYGEEQLQIVKAPDWENLSVIATFNPPNKKPVQVVVDSVTGVIKVPKEATADLYGVGTIVFVGLADGVQRISADCEYIVRKHSNASGTEPAEPTPDLLQQVLTLSKDAQTAAKNAEQSAKNAAKDAADTVKPYKEEAVRAATAAAGSANAAENSASAAAGSEQAAGTSELKAAKSEKAAKASEQAASESAQAALESKTAAATSEVNAAASAKKAQDVADSLPEDYTTAVNDIATLKQQVANITPDDSSIGDKPWSSKNIIDMLCPPLEESGNPVVCYPVAGYPLGVKAKWEPTQEGTGTPSPENIRPINGRDSVMVERCGANLSKISDISTPNKSLTPVELPTEIVTDIEISFDTLNAEIEKVGTAFFLNKADGKWKAITVQDFGISTAGKIPNGRKTAVFHGVTFKSVETVIIKNGYCKWSGDVNNFCVSIIQNAPYTPYIGSTNTLTLPETVYGGEVDAVSGEGQETQKLVILNGTESWNSWGINAHNPAITGFYTYDINDYDAKNAKGICSHLETPNQDVWGGRNVGIGFATVGSSRYFIFSILTSSLPDISAGHEVASLKAYIAAQNAAGTPVQIAYKLEKPVPFTATGAQPITALAGVNTVLTDADSATVTGRADPIKRITDLEDAVASQT